MVAFDELRHLEAYLFEEREKHGKKMSELYELVCTPSLPFFKKNPDF